MALSDAPSQYITGRKLPTAAGQARPLDPGLRRAIHGPIQSMDEDRERSFWHWLFHAD